MSTRRRSTVWMGLLGLLLASTASAAPPDSRDRPGGGVPDRIAALEARVAELERLLAALSLQEDGETLRFTGVNVQIVSGSGATDGAVNGRGNLIVGYGEGRGIPKCGPAGCRFTPPVRTGSHNLIVGPEHSWTEYGGLVAGFGNNVLAPFASVSGGAGNAASGESASVVGGVGNRASGPLSLAGGGVLNEAEGSSASAIGGEGNVASGQRAAVTGGSHNQASAHDAVVSGGWRNEASAAMASVHGGVENEASGLWAAVCGGANNHASGDSASVSGGRNNEADGSASAVSGGELRTAPGDVDWAAGSLREDR